MKFGTISKRILSVILLLAMLLSTFPVPAGALESSSEASLWEEKPATKAGKDYTSTINALAKPAASYSTHYDKIKDLAATDRGNVPAGYYVMMVRVTENGTTKNYAFAPGSLTAGYHATIPALEVTIADNGNYIYFGSETDARNATMLLTENTNPTWSYERQFARWDGKGVEAVNYNDAAMFSIATPSNNTYGFYFNPGLDGLTPFKGIQLSGDSARLSYYIGYQDGSFRLEKDPTFEKNKENTKFYFYQLTRLTENLYDAIRSAKSYATGNANGTYDQELYDGFIALLEDCISVYNEYNHYLSEAERERTVSYRNALNTRAENLLTYINLLSTAGKNPNYSTIVSSLPASRGWGNEIANFEKEHTAKDYRGLDGKYFIVHFYNSTNYLLLPYNQPASNRLGSTAVTVTNGSIVNASVDNALDLIYEHNADDTDTKCYYLRRQDGSYLRAELSNGSPIITWGHAHQSFGLGIIASNNERVYLHRNINYTIDGTHLGSNNVSARLNYKRADLQFILEPSGASGENQNFRLFRLTWSTEELLSAIQEMTAYVSGASSNSVSGVYNDFLSCLDESIAMYLRYNLAHSTEQFENTTAIQDELKAQVTRLRSYKSILSQPTYIDVIENLDTPYNELYTDPLSRHHAMNIRQVCGASYYIVHVDPKGDGSTGWAWVAEDGMYIQDANNRIYGAPVEILNDRLVNAIPTYAFDLKENRYNGKLYPYEFSPWPTYNTCFYVSEGSFIPNNTGPDAIAFKTGSQAAFEIKVYDDGFTMQLNKNFDGIEGNENYYLQYVPELEGFRPYRLDSIQGTVSRFALYRISSHVMELYNAITRMAVYAEGSNADGRYPADLYSAFLTDLQECIDLYQYYNTAVLAHWDEAALKETLDQKAETLLSHIDTLTLGDTKAEYIDIPVEILDFRADGFMFEYDNNTHGLSAAATVATALGLKESTLQAATRKYLSFTAADGTVYSSTVSQNLTEPYLVDGKMVYREKALKQIAYTTLAGVSVEPNNIPGQNTGLRQKADAIANAASKYTVESANWMKVLGSASDTFAKTTTGKNGGDLAWEDVETGYDFAYYIMNYLWRPVLQGDSLDDGYSYNVTVDERAVFRLFKDDKGYYTLDAANWVENTGYYTYNAYPYADATTVHRDSPNFTPINGLGFETPGYMPEDADTDRGEHIYNNTHYSTENANFHFTVHAKGSFVYYEEQDLYFEFLGDDDVYFYIDGQLVMDLGGGHQAAGDTLYLNSIAASHGLKDGEVYSFDMFYAERKTSAANLRFSTNMQLMDPDLITKKNQYDATTGSPIMDGAAVNVGTPVSYSFEMENHSDLPVVDLTFSDPTLGIYMSKDKVTIDPALSSTKVTDITLTYRSFDRKTGELFVGNISYHNSYTYFKDKLTGHVEDTSNPQPHKGQYTYTVKSADELKAILEIGIPANFLLTISGMVRNTTEGKYVNTVTTSAHPVTLDASGGIIPLSPVYANASRNIYGIDQSNIVIPEPLQIVLDYGKPIALPMNELWTRITLKDKNLSPTYVGLIRTGENGLFRVKQPGNLFCIGDSSPVTIDCGTYYLDGNTPTFRLTEQMTHSETVFAVYRLSLRDSGEVFGYVYQEIQLHPATLMYYETDFTEDFVSIQHVKENGTTESVNTIVWDSESAKTAPEEKQDDGTVTNGDAFVKTASEEKDYTDALFFDFSNTAIDQTRYTASQYAGKNYDTMDSWKLDHSSTAIGNGVIDNQAGTLTFSPVKTFQVDGNGSSTANRLDLCNKDDLAYDPSRAEILQVRFKLENMSAGNAAPFFRLWWWGKKGDKTYQGYELAQYLSASYSSDDTYLVFSLDLRSINDESYTNSGSSSGFIDLRELDVLTDFRFSLHNFAVSPSSKITYDYLYIGPKNNAPVQHGGDSLYFTFDNTDSDQDRYLYPQYNGLSPDTENWTSFHYINPKLYDAGNAGKKNTHYTTPLIDNISGIITIPAATWIKSAANSNSLSFVLEGLRYSPASAEVVEIRAKFLNISHCGETGSECTNMDFRYKTDAAASSFTLYSKGEYDFKPPTNTSEGDIVNKFNTFTINLGSDFRELDDITGIRLNFENFFTTEDSRIVLDYVYIGPAADAPSKQNSLYSAPKDDFLYFGYENDDDAAARYSSSVYNGRNFDTLLTPDSTVNWMAQNNQAMPTLSMDNSAGTLTVTTTVDPYDPAKYTPTDDQNDERFYFQTGHCGSQTQPVNYSPGNAEIVQVRLKFKGFTYRGNGETPRLQFRCHKDGYVYDPNADNCTVALSETIPLDIRYMDADEYITFSAPVVSNVAKYGRLNTIRLDFLDFDWVEGGTTGTITIDYIYVGPKDSAPDPVYGYDSSYENDTKYSNHSSLYVEGTGVYLEKYPGDYTRAEFSFTGTGFDVIATTGDQTAALRMELFDEEGTLVKRMTVNTKGELELYQIPVISVQGLEYGTYHVTMDVNDRVDSTLDILKRGNKFYFDAIRIYDPVDTTKEKLTDSELQNTIAHLMDHEDRSHIKEIRNILLSVSEFSALSGSGTGALFVDAYEEPSETLEDPNTDETINWIATGININNHYAMDVVTYNKVGPKNEVYLDPHQAVAFKLEVDSSNHANKTLIPISLDVGAKTIAGGKEATLVAAVVKGGKTTDTALSITTKTTVTLSSATAMYRPLTITRDMLTKEGSKYYCYVVLYNNTKATAPHNGDYVISLTDVKLCYVLDPNASVQDNTTDPEVKPDVKAPISAEEAESVNFVVDGSTTKAAAMVIASCLETPLSEDSPTLGHSLNLASDISINYVAKKTDLAEYDSFYLECVVEGREGSLRIDPVEKGEYYYFTLEGLTAVHMANEVTATLHLEKEGRTYYAEADHYSIAQYAYTQMSKSNASPKLKALCAELLRYGSMAQVFKGYSTDRLADSNMTEAQKALLTDLSSVTFGKNNKVLSEITAPKVTWAGKSLILDSKVTIRYVVDIKDSSVNADDLSIRVRYTDYAGIEKVVTLTNAQPYGDKDGRYSFDFDTLLAAELRTSLYATVYVGDTRVSDTLLYSADTYGNNKTGTLLDLCRALVAYSDSAKAFFG